MGKPRILLADDHTLVVEAFKKLLETEFDIVGAVADGHALLEVAPALKPDVVILDLGMPLLNGMAHIDFLSARFGGRTVLGSQCVISTTLDAEGRILHLNDTHGLSFGELDGLVSARASAERVTRWGQRGRASGI